MCSISAFIKPIFTLYLTKLTLLLNVLDDYMLEILACNFFVYKLRIFIQKIDSCKKQFYIHFSFCIYTPSGMFHDLPPILIRQIPTCEPKVSILLQEFAITFSCCSPYPLNIKKFYILILFSQPLKLHYE
ncbi:hypothetical protein CW304_19325 [Bacillus sp. UFRGS-B20]|nr:hypothetical protein CW304_19325 [Bacillus sp. UFRGS-B20]